MTSRVTLKPVQVRYLDRDNSPIFNEKLNITAGQCTVVAGHAGRFMVQDDLDVYMMRRMYSGAQGQHVVEMKLMA